MPGPPPSPDHPDGDTASDADAPSPGPNRRRFLAGLAGLATLGSVAGCGSRGSPGDTATDTQTDADLGPAPEPAGPWPQARADAGNTGVVTADGPTADPSLRWSVTSAGAVGATVAQATGTATPGERVHVAGEDGRVAAVGPDGTRKWLTALPEARFPPAAGAGRVVVPVGNALVVLDASTGDRVRSVEVPADSFDTPTLVDDTALVGTFSGGVVGVDLGSGTVRWQAGAPSRAHPPVVADGTAYVTARRWETDDGDRPGVIAAVDVESGEIDWEVGLDGEPTAPPAVRDGVVYAGTNRGRVHAVDAGDGARRWREPVGDWVTRGPTAAADGVYVVVLGEGPAKLDHGGTVVWRSDVGGGTNPVLVEDLVVVGTEDGVVAVDRETGRTRWRAGTDAGVEFDVRAADGRVYAGDRHGTLSAFEVDGGERVWRVPFRPTRMPGPVVGPRTVAGGSRDGGTYDLLATDGTEFPRSGGAATRGVTPTVLDGRDLPTEATPAGTADGDRLFGAGTGTAGGSAAASGSAETLLGGGADGSLFRVRTVDYGDAPTDGLGPTPTPTQTPGPDEPTATRTPHIDFPAAAPAWTTTLDVEIRSPVTSAGGVAYAGTAEGIVAVDPRDGSERFRVPLGAAVDGAPAVADGRLFAVTAGGRLVGIDIDAEEQNRIDWGTTLDVGSGAGPTVVDGRVFVAGDEGLISAYTTDGDPVWDRPLDAAVAGGTAVTGAYVVVGTEAAEVVALDRADGSIAWRADARGPVRGTPAVADGSDPTAYAAAHDGTLSAFDVGDGSVRFRRRIGRWLDAPPAVGHGAVFVADQTGRVYAVVGE
jgi:outer membrane protein assembly factor BamB